jgi:rod shape-determining protein MreD
MLALQATAAPRIALFDAVPDLLIILVVQLALLCPHLEGVIWSWAAGLLADLRWGNPAGVVALTYALVALVIYGVRRQIFAGHILTRLLLVVLADLLQHLAVMFSQIIRGQTLYFLLFWRQALLGVAYTTLAAVVLLPLLSVILGRLYRERRAV